MVTKCGCPRGVLGVTFWLVFSAGLTTCLPIQTLNEILRSVESDDSLLRADLETLYSFAHKSWNPQVVNNEVTTELEWLKRDPRFYVLGGEVTESDQTNTTTTTEKGQKKDVDPWSLIWYMASFGGLVTFFLVVSCSECCCSKRAGPNNNNINSRTAEPPPEVTQWVDETPPPPYHLFAPPSYDTLFYGTTEEKNKCEVYVVPIHSHMVSLQTATSSTSVTPT